MKLSIRNTIILSTLISVSLIGLSFISYTKSKQIIQESFDTLADSKLSSIQTQIESWITDKQQIQETIAETTTLKNGNLNEIHEYDKRLKGRIPNIENAVVYGDLKGNIYLPEGKILNVSNLPTFLESMKGKEITIDPLPSASNGKPSIISASPVFDDNKKVIAWESGGYYIDDLTNPISKISLGETGYATVFTKDGTIVIHPNKEYILKKKISDFKNKNLDKLVQDAISGKKGFITTTFNGKETLFYYSKTTNGWGIMLQIPKSEAYAKANELLTSVILFTIITILITAVINFFIIRNSLKPLEVMSNQTKSLATNKGDLTQRLEVKSNNEIGELSSNFNSMLDNLQNLIKNILKKGENVSDNSNRLNQNIEQFVELSESITSNIQEISEASNEQLISHTKNLHSVEEISKNISEIKNSTSLISNESLKIFEQAKEGNDKVENLEGQMEVIQNSVRNASEIIKNLGSRSEEIGEIVHMISMISDQTNLLALNASIEAARAGEHGKGFSVVADEVKKLAEKSSESSKQIYDIILKIQNETTEAMKGMEIGTTEVNIGAEKAKEIGYLLNNIVQSTEDSAKQIEKMVKETEQLLNRTKDVEKNIKDSTLSVETSASYLEDFASSSEEQLTSIADIKSSIENTTKIANELRQLLNEFKVNQ